MTMRPASFIPPAVSSVVGKQGEQLTVGEYLPFENAAYVRVENPVNAEGLVDVGTIEPGTARRLAELLRPHTTTPEECFFLVWEGYAAIRDGLGSAVTVDIAAGRTMLILSGQVSDGAESVDDPPVSRTPQWWLPSDGAWIVANDIYGAGVYVGGPEVVVAAILAAPELDTRRATHTEQLIAEQL